MRTESIWVLRKRFSHEKELIELLEKSLSELHIYFVTLFERCHLINIAFVFNLYDISSIAYREVGMRKLRERRCGCYQRAKAYGGFRGTKMLSFNSRWDFWKFVPSNNGPRGGRQSMGHATGISWKILGEEWRTTGSRRWNWIITRVTPNFCLNHFLVLLSQALSPTLLPERSRN